MQKKAKIATLIYISVVIASAILPFFIPPTISDYSYIDWKGKDLSKELYENEDYINDTFEDFNQPEHLYYYDVKGESYEKKVTMVTLQGLVNKHNTSLFVDIVSYDEFWFKRLVEYYNITYTNLSDLEYWDVIAQFKDSIAGLVVYDENLIDTVNVATFLASLKECLVITNGMKDDFEALGITRCASF